MHGVKLLDLENASFRLDANFVNSLRRPDATVTFYSGYVASARMESAIQVKTGSTWFPTQYFFLTMLSAEHPRLGLTTLKTHLTVKKLGSEFAQKRLNFKKLLFCRARRLKSSAVFLN